MNLRAKPDPLEREIAFREWWAGLTKDQKLAEIRAGHVSVALPHRPKAGATKNQKKALRRARRGK